MRSLLYTLIRGYQLFISSWRKPSCRFYPSCSNYALQALQIHGSIAGGALSLKRLARCHPLNSGGYDPVPPCISSCNDPNSPSNNLIGKSP
ncbi:MAG: membrane protein insertion efficiency factor YidD [Gammaproteobacteria bacterium]|nr:membrane protein insertion efficiency factor YidD [Gammaproteobacteria bacterium]